ncbi:Tetratricopeptide repeat protein [compost metagenome]
MRTNRWSEAIELFKASIDKRFTSQACHNIGVAEYQMGHYEAAASFFRQTSAELEGSACGYAQCLIKLEKTDKAEEVLRSLPFSKESRISDIELAKLYAALNRYDDAVYYYNKGWNAEWKKSDWVNGYVYALFKTDNHTRRRAVLKEAAAHCDMQMIEAVTDLDEEWTLEQRKSYIAERQAEKENYQTLLKRLVSGYVPSLLFEPALESGCYLFGCRCRKAKQSYVEAVGPAAAR